MDDRTWLDRWMEKYMSGKIWDDRSEDVGNMVERYGQLHFGMLRSHVNMFGLVFIPKKCSPYITHVIQNS